MERDADIVVVGAGIVACATAYFLVSGSIGSRIDP
jgi:glycine/D-amino acid oxidase-like deaminating enzyme